MLDLEQAEEVRTEWVPSKTAEKSPITNEDELVRQKHTLWKNVTSGIIILIMVVDFLLTSRDVYSNKLGCYRRFAKYGYPTLSCMG